MVALLIVVDVVLEPGAEVSSFAVVLASAVVSTLPELVINRVVVGVAVPEGIEEIELEVVALPLIEVVSAPEVVLEPLPVVAVLCGPVVVPVLLVAGPPVVADCAVDVAEEVFAGWDDVLVFPPVVVPKEDT